MRVAKVTILWNAGWDDLEIDLDNIRNLSEPELTERVGDPFLGKGDWLRCSFLRGLLKSDVTAVKILRKIASGD